MSEYHSTVKQYINELDLTIIKDIPEDGLFVVNDEANGIRSLIIDCEEPILIIEQFLFTLSKEAAQSAGILLRLLQMNRDLVHGAFVVDEEGDKVLFRDTLQLKNLDLNELEGSINSLSLGLAEHGEEIITFSKK